VNEPDGFAEHIPQFYITVILPELLFLLHEVIVEALLNFDVEIDTNKQDSKRQNDWATIKRIGWSKRQCEYCHKFLIETFCW